MSGMWSAHISYQAVQCRYHQSFSSSRGQKVTSRAAIWLNGLISSTFIFTAIPKISNASVDKNSCTNGKRTLAIHQCSQAHKKTKKMDALSNVHLKIYSINCRLSLSIANRHACRYTKLSAISTSAYAVQLRHTKC